MAVARLLSTCKGKKVLAFCVLFYSALSSATGLSEDFEHSVPQCDFENELLKGSESLAESIRNDYPLRQDTASKIVSFVNNLIDFAALSNDKTIEEWKPAVPGLKAMLRKVFLESAQCSNHFNLSDVKVLKETLKAAIPSLETKDALPYFLEVPNFYVVNDTNCSRAGTFSYYSEGSKFSYFGPQSLGLEQLRNQAGSFISSHTISQLRIGKTAVPTKLARFLARALLPKFPTKGGEWLLASERSEGGLCEVGRQFLELLPGFDLVGQRSLIDAVFRTMLGDWKGCPHNNAVFVGSAFVDYDKTRGIMNEATMALTGDRDIVEFSESIEKLITMISDAVHICIYGEDAFDMAVGTMLARLQSFLLCLVGSSADEESCMTSMRVTSYCEDMTEIPDPPLTITQQPSTNENLPQLSSDAPRPGGEVEFSKQVTTAPATTLRATSTLTTVPATAANTSTTTSATSSSTSSQPTSTKATEGNACFPSAATVELRDGRILLMRDLKVGDNVRVSAGEFSPVILFTHANNLVPTNMLRLTFVLNESTGRSAEEQHVTLSPGHLIESSGKLVAAANLALGSEVSIYSSSLDSLVTGSLVSVDFVSGVGLFNPQTAHGDIVVDNIVCSTFTTAVHPKLARALLLPLGIAGRSFNMFFPGLSSFFKPWVPRVEGFLRLVSNNKEL